MTTFLTVTAKGQVTLRKELLEHLGVAPGEKIAVDLLPTGRAAIRSAQPPGVINAFIGCLVKPGTKPLSVEDMKEIAAAGWAGEK